MCRFFEEFLFFDIFFSLGWFSQKIHNKFSLILIIIWLFFWLLFLSLKIIPRRNIHKTGRCIRESEKGLAFTINSGQLIGYGRKNKLRPFFKFIFIVFRLILQNLECQRIWIYIVNQLSHAYDELIQSKIYESLLISDSSQVLLKVLFRVFYFENHYGQKLGVNTWLIAFFIFLFLQACASSFFVWKFFRFQKPLINCKQISHKIVNRLCTDKSMLVWALERVLKLLQW